MDSIDDIIKRSREMAEDLLNSQREDSLQNGIKLRNTTQLREPGTPLVGEPINFSSPSFKLGEANGFSGKQESGPFSSDTGHMSKQGFETMLSQLEAASKMPDVASRDAAVGRAAKTVAKEWSSKHGVKENAIHEARAQVVFASQELGSKIGLNKTESSILGYSMERALEKEGFKVGVSRAIDWADKALGDSFKPTASSTAVATGMRHNMEQTLNKSMQWMAEHGVTKEALKNVLANHTGKFQAVAQLASNPEVVRKAAQTIAQSDTLVSAAVKMSKDSEFRNAVGDMALAGGEAVSSVNKAAGSVAILTGAALKGESTEDMARHAFRAGMSVLGGAAGGVGGTLVSPGFGTVAGATAGSMAGSKIADLVMEKYDQFFGAKEMRGHVSADEMENSKSVIASRMSDKMHEKQNGPQSEAGGQGSEKTMEHQMGRRMGRG